MDLRDVERFFPDDTGANPVARTREFDPDETTDIAAHFAIPTPSDVRVFGERGNINLHTFEVVAAGRPYLLQRINTAVFTKPYRVMRAMVAYCSAQREYLRGDPNIIWEPIELIATREGSPFYDRRDPHGWSVWRLMRRIEGCRSYKSLGEVADREDRLRLAEEVGRGLALNADLTSGVPVETLKTSLPGYRDTAGYFAQFRAVLAGCRTISDAAPFLPEDVEVRSATEPLYRIKTDEAAVLARRSEPGLAEWLALVRESEPIGLVLQAAVTDGLVRKTAIHGDTKIENFLFDRETGRVRSLVDLDTIMPFTWLADWGDMVRSLCNVAGEKEYDLARVGVDRDVYAAVRRGLLATAREATPAEKALMPEAVEAIALELGVRFLTDYLRGDDYFRLTPQDPPDLNRQRGLVQLTLFRRLRELRDWAKGLDDPRDPSSPTASPR